MSDLNGLHQISNQIDELEKKQAIAFGLADLGIWEYNLLSGELNWDFKMFEICDIDPSTFTRQYIDFEKLVHPDDLQSMQQTIAESNKNKLSYEYNVRIKTQHNTYKQVRGWGRTIFNNKNEPVTMIGVLMAL